MRRGGRDVAGGEADGEEQDWDRGEGEGVVRRDAEQETLQPAIAEDGSARGFRRVEDLERGRVGPVRTGRSALLVEFTD